jgi:hypothetical protein
MSKQETKQTEYKQYIGRIISPENRNRIKGELQAYFINTIAKQEKYGELSNEGILTAANTYANHFVGRERKHFAAYLEGKSFYDYKGATYPVLTDTSKPVFFSDMSELYGLDVNNLEEIVPYEKDEEE